MDEAENQSVCDDESQNTVAIWWPQDEWEATAIRDALIEQGMPCFYAGRGMMGGAAFNFDVIRVRQLYVHQCDAVRALSFIESHDWPSYAPGKLSREMDGRRNPDDESSEGNTQVDRLVEMNDGMAGARNRELFVRMVCFFLVLVLGFGGLLVAWDEGKDWLDRIQIVGMYIGVASTFGLFAWRGYGRGDDHDK